MKSKVHTPRQQQSQRESVCMCVIGSSRGVVYQSHAKTHRASERICAKERERERESVCVCVCVCVCDRCKEQR